jgi:hypothetical protein
MSQDIACNLMMDNLIYQKNNPIIEIISGH